MNPEDEQDKTQNEQEQQPLSDQGVTKKIAQKGFQALRGLGVTGEAATAAETGTAAAGAQTAGAGATTAAAGATEGAAAATGAAGAAASAEGALTSTAAIASGSASMSWALAIVLIVIFIFTIVIVITGGGAGVNLGAEPPPGPGPDEQPTSITFQGGEAYLTTGDGCRVNCPTVSKGETATIKVEIFFDTALFNRNINNVRAIIPIDILFFSNINADGNPEITSIPTLNNYYIYTWKLPKPLRNHYTFTITGKIQTESGDTNVILSMSGVTIVDNNLGDIYAGATSRPTTNTCNKYGGVMDNIKADYPTLPASNYGDPVCSYTPARFRKVVEATESNHENWDFWNDIADCESTSPNGYTKNDIGGSWGKFQMRRSFPLPGKTWDPEKNDRGDVPWQKQIANAISYNNSLNASNNNFGYWGTAMCLCYYDNYRNDSYCKDIIRKGNVRSPSSGKCSACTASKGRS